MSDEKIAGGFVMGDGLQQGGVIEPGQTIWGHDQAEVVYLPKNAQVLPATPAPAKDFKVVIHEHVIDEQMRAMIREEIHNALYPGGTIDGHEHRRVEMVEESGKCWRGVLYRVDEHATNPELPVAKEEHRG